MWITCRFLALIYKTKRLNLATLELSQNTPKKSIKANTLADKRISTPASLSCPPDNAFFYEVDQLPLNSLFTAIFYDPRYVFNGQFRMFAQKFDNNVLPVRFSEAIVLYKRPVFYVRC